MEATVSSYTSTKNQRPKIVSPMPKAFVKTAVVVRKDIERNKCAKDTWLASVPMGHHVNLGTQNFETLSGSSNRLQELVSFQCIML
jgi:hypothetical protein